MTESVFYHHICLKCNGAAFSPCHECGSRGSISKMLGFARTPCGKCKGKRYLRCDACAGTGKFKIYKLPAVLAGVEMEHTQQYYDTVCERLKAFTNMIIDTVEYHAIRTVPGSSELLTMDGTSTLEMKPAGMQMEGFVDGIPVSPAQWLKSKLNALATNPSYYTRFIGRLLEIKEMQPPALGCHYKVQCYFLDLTDTSKPQPEASDAANML